MNDMVEEFLRELKELCGKYQASISGCGCCGSPLVTMGEYKFDGLDVEPDYARLSNSYSYDWENEEGPQEWSV